jgi:hypothetical protein
MLSCKNGGMIHGMNQKSQSWAPFAPFEHSPTLLGWSDCLMGIASPLPNRTCRRQYSRHRPRAIFRRLPALPRLRRGRRRARQVPSHVSLVRFRSGSGLSQASPPAVALCAPWILARPSRRQTFLPRGVVYLADKRPGNHWIPTWKLMVPETLWP